MDIPSLNKLICHFCERRITPESTHYYKAVLSQNESIIKITVCLDCIDAKIDELLCFWKKKIKIDGNRLKDVKRLFFLLERLESIKEVTDEIRLHKYLLGLFLLRKKKLSFAGRSTVNGKTIMELRHNKSGRIYSIEEITMGDNEIGTLTEKFLKFLEVAE